jgi:YYY domain-containing protein
MNEPAVFFAWWLAATLLGVIAFPICFFTFRHLPDRGYTFSRTLGLLVASYFGWLSAHAATGLVPIAVGLGALALLAAYLGRGLWAQQREFLKSSLGTIAVAEILFFVLLAFGTWYEASTGAIYQTEKPADFTVLNGILQTPHVPPRDPWAAGAYVSYYYFGYYMLAFLAKLTGTAAVVAYNMGLALTLAQTGIVAFGLGYALTRKRGWGLLLVFAMTFMGNLDYWFRAPHVYRYGDLQARYLSNRAPDPNVTKGLGGTIDYLLHPAAQAVEDGRPNPAGHNWEYFQASRIIDLTPGEHLISEFPAFGFVLADVHPHLISLPFFMLCLALALSLARAPWPGWRALGPDVGRRIVQLVLVGLVFGSLGFINSWDLPTVLAVLGAALVMRELWSGQPGAGWLVRASAVGAPIALLAVLAYVPFYQTLRTQARGIGLLLHDPIPNEVAARTDLYYWLVLVGPFLLVLVPALIERARGTTWVRRDAARADDEAAKAARAKRAKRAEAKAAAVPAPPARACSLCGVPVGEGVDTCPSCGGDVISVATSAALPESGLWRRLGALGRVLAGGVAPWGYVVLLLVVAVAIFDLLLPLWNPAVTFFSLVLMVLALASIASRGDSRELSFAAALAAIGFLLIAGAEWFYVRDLFSQYPHLYRMNTVFKLYMQAWVLLSAASVALLAWMWEAVWPGWRPISRRVWTGLAVFVGIGVVAFPFMAYYNRVSQYGAPPGQSQLDGTEFLRFSPDPGVQADGRALDWMRAHVSAESDDPPRILEAWSGSFVLSARVATYVGLPTIIGWEGHEEQWRGGKDRPIWHGVDAEDTVRRRYEDVNQLYTTADLGLARFLLDRYKIRYVYVGPYERSRYPEGDFSKWEKLGRAIYSDGPVTIYELPSPRS